VESKRVRTNWGANRQEGREAACKHKSRRKLWSRRANRTRRCRWETMQPQTLHKAGRQKTQRIGEVIGAQTLEKAGRNEERQRRWRKKNRGKNKAGKWKQPWKLAISTCEGNTRAQNRLISWVFYISKYPLCYSTFQKLVLFPIIKYPILLIIQCFEILWYLDLNYLFL
jgi:hypothetical protein